MRIVDLQTSSSSALAEGRGYRRGAGGSTLVEMALLVPVLLTLMFGVIELGALSYSWVTVQQAARMASRVAITGAREKDIISEAKRVTKRLPPGSDVVVTLEDDEGPCSLVEVRVRYIYRPFTPIISSLMEPVELIGRDRKLNEPFEPCE